MERSLRSGTEGVCLCIYNEHPPAQRPVVHFCERSVAHKSERPVVSETNVL